MKNLLLLSAFTLSISVNAAIECAKIGTQLYPASREARAVADAVKANTCTSKSFLTAIEAMKTKMVIVPSSKELESRIEQDRAVKRSKRVEKQLRKAGLLQ